MVLDVFDTCYRLCVWYTWRRRLDSFPSLRECSNTDAVGRAALYLTECSVDKLGTIHKQPDESKLTEPDGPLTTACFNKKQPAQAAQLLTESVSVSLTESMSPNRGTRKQASDQGGLVV